MSVRQINPSFVLELSLETAVGFVVGFALTLGFSRSQFKRTAPLDLDEKKRVWAMSYGAVAAVGIAAAFVFGVKDLSTPRLIEVAIGVAAAILVLAVLGTFLLKTIHFLNKDEEHNSI